MDFAALDALLDYFQANPKCFELEVSNNLVALRVCLVKPPPPYIIYDILEKDLVNMVNKVGSFVYSLENPENLDLDALSKCISPDDHSMLDLLNYAASICREKITLDVFPKTDQLGFISHLVGYLEEAVRAKADDSFAFLKYDIRIVQEKFRGVMNNSRRIPHHRWEALGVKVLLSAAADLAYQAEYAIDMHLTGRYPMRHCMSWLRQISHDLDKYNQSIFHGTSIKSWLDSHLGSERWGVSTRVVSWLLDDETEKEVTAALELEGLRKKFGFVGWLSIPDTYEENKSSICEEFAAAVEENFNAQKLSRRNRVYIFRKYDETLLRGHEREIYLGLEQLGYFVVLYGVKDEKVLSDVLRFLPDNKNGLILVLSSSPQLVRHIRSRPSRQWLLERRLTTSQRSQRNDEDIKEPAVAIDDGVVGFKDESDNMMAWFRRDERKLQIASIYGMAGQGKTTLAKKLFRIASEAGYFQRCAWCTVSQVYRRRELLLELLHQVAGQASNAFDDRSDYDLKEELYRNLLGRKYLIVMDDIWDSKAWDELRRCFPDDDNGSCILFTTRLQELAAEAHSGSILQPLKLLSDDESWVLLERQLSSLGGCRCPDELRDVGREIATKCKGLPLAVMVAAGLLSKLDKTESVWEQVSQTLSQHIVGDSEVQCRTIIELSFEHLPDCLKPCFLYLGAFLEDRVIPVWKIVRLWIAEGFVQSSQLGSLRGDSHGQSIEDVAVSYLMELVGRSLILVANKSSKGGIKACALHDILRMFCVMKAKEQFFMHHIDGYDERFPSSPASSDPSNDDDDDEHFASFNLSAINPFKSTTPPEIIRYDERRLRIYSKRKHFAMLKPQGPYVRSLLFFATSDDSATCSYDVSFISEHFQLLKILDLEDINIGNSFKFIAILVHLTYLAVQCDADSLPQSISNLKNLQTLIVKGVSAKKVIKVPDSIWDLSKLRHVDIIEGDFEVEPDRAVIPNNLHTLSKPSLAYGDAMEKILRALTTIQKLDCIFLDSPKDDDDTSHCNRFPVLDFLNQLDSLKAFYNGRKRLSLCIFHLPSNLTKLTLSNFGMPWSNIAQLMHLPRLEVLKLLCDAFKGEAWHMDDDQVFPNLRFLNFDSLDIETWSASQVNFPLLEKLVLHRCQQLKEIPAGMGDITTLQRIDVMLCSLSAAESAREIQEDQSDFCHKIKVHLRI